MTRLKASLTGRHTFFSFIITILLASAAVMAQDLAVYPGPGEMTSDTRYQVFVRKSGEQDWKELFVYSAKVNVRHASKTGRCAFVNFDASFQSPIEVQVRKRSGSFSNVEIRPSSAGVSAKPSKQSLQFTVSKPSKLSVEFDGDRLNNLFIFANPPETNIPEKSDPNVVYFGPGVHSAENVKVKSGQTVYLHGSAYVKGFINLYDKNNVTVRGRGIISGEDLNHDRSKTRVNVLKFKNGNNIRVEGITLVDSPVWSLYFDQCKDVTVSNVKEMCYMINADGITLSQSQNVNIENVFVRTADDNISIKNMAGGTTDRINVKNAVLWADDAHNMLVGPESRGGTFQNIDFSNIDVLENTQPGGTYAGVMSIMSGDGGTTSDVSWRSIRVGDITAGDIIRLHYSKVHSRDKSFGVGVSNISFSDITYKGSRANPGVIKGVDKSKTIDNVSVKNFKFNDTVLSDSPAPAAGRAEARSLRQSAAPQQGKTLQFNDFVRELKILK